MHAEKWYKMIAINYAFLYISSHELWEASPFIKLVAMHYNYLWQHKCCCKRCLKHDITAPEAARHLYISEIRGIADAVGLLLLAIQWGR